MGIDQAMEALGSLFGRAPQATQPPPSAFAGVPILGQLLQYEAGFQGSAWIEFTRAHTEIPIFAVCAYFLVVFYVPNLLDESGHSGFKLRGPFAAWNLILAVFFLGRHDSHAPAPHLLVAHPWLYLHRLSRPTTVRLSTTPRGPRRAP